MDTAQPSHETTPKKHRCALHIYWVSANQKISSQVPAGGMDPFLKFPNIHYRSHRSLRTGVRKQISHFVCVRRLRHLRWGLAMPRVVSSSLHQKICGSMGSCIVGSTAIVRRRDGAQKQTAFVLSYILLESCAFKTPHTAALVLFRIAVSESSHKGCALIVEPNYLIHLSQVSESPHISESSHPCTINTNR